MLKNRQGLSAGRQGYSLIEFLVAMSIFAIVIIVVFTLFSMVIKGQRRIIAQQNTQEDARFLVAFMAKEIRMSKITSSNGVSTNLTLVRPDNDSVTYSISNGKIYRNSNQINSDGVFVVGNFYVEGTDAGIIDNQQPKITIALGIQGVGARIEEKAKINIQTTLSPRNLDL